MMAAPANNEPTPGGWELGLQALQRVLLDYPVASQAAFAALVAEGRRFASTQEGQAWERRLAESDVVRDGRVVWEVISQNAFSEDKETLLPSVLLDAIARAAAVKNLEPTLSMIFEERF